MLSAWSCRGIQGANTRKRSCMSKFSKSDTLGMIVSVIFVISGLYLAMMYLLEFPEPVLHWEGIVPLGVCLLFYLIF